MYEYTIAYIVSVWNIVATQINNPREFVQRVSGDIHVFFVHSASQYIMTFNQLGKVRTFSITVVTVG